jgi:hypothetical protein
LLGQQFDFIGLAGTDVQGRVGSTPLASHPGNGLHARSLSQKAKLLQFTIEVRKTQIHTNQNGWRNR